MNFPYTISLIDERIKHLQLKNVYARAKNDSYVAAQTKCKIEELTKAKECLNKHELIEA